MARVRLYEDDEEVGYVDTATGETTYAGDDRAVELFLADIDGGLTEAVSSEPRAETRTITGEKLRERAVRVLEELGVECRVEEGDT